MWRTFSIHKTTGMAQRSNFSLSQYSGIEMVSPAGSEEHSNLNMKVGNTLLAALAHENLFNFTLYVILTGTGIKYKCKSEEIT